MPVRQSTSSVTGGQSLLRLVACLALIVAGLYLSWRLTATLNLSVWWVSVPLWFMELHAVVAFALFVFTAWDVYALPPPRSCGTSLGG